MIVWSLWSSIVLLWHVTRPQHAIKKHFVMLFGSDLTSKCTCFARVTSPLTKVFGTLLCSITYGFGHLFQIYRSQREACKPLQSASFMAAWPASISLSLSSGGVQTVHPAASSSGSGPDGTIQTFHEETCLWPLGGQCEKMCSRAGDPDEYGRAEQTGNRYQLWLQLKEQQQSSAGRWKTPDCCFI